eukprot:TRINITY_DN7784_c0_g1_i3.p1 TRINITY_DN7784_c0_g1~~TRINITY_DN7784_c0_g1_i3.p1  ORF type:complete len:261 (+),score=36.85 TRINITY_DN7784_c0_g1_i3:96-878(+)
MHPRLHIHARARCAGACCVDACSLLVSLCLLLAARWSRHRPDSYKEYLQTGGFRGDCMGSHWMTSTNLEAITAFAHHILRAVTLGAAGLGRRATERLEEVPRRRPFQQLARYFPDIAVMGLLLASIEACEGYVPRFLPDLETPLPEAPTQEDSAQLDTNELMQWMGKIGVPRSAFVGFQRELRRIGDDDVAEEDLTLRKRAVRLSETVVIATEVLVRRECLSRRRRRARRRAVGADGAPSRTSEETGARDCSFCMHKLWR